jgi:hypothetical protein
MTHRARRHLEDASHVRHNVERAEVDAAEINGRHEDFGGEFVFPRRSLVAGGSL